MSPKAARRLGFVLKPPAVVNGLVNSVKLSGWSYTDRTTGNRCSAISGVSPGPGLVIHNRCPASLNTNSMNRLATSACCAPLATAMGSGVTMVAPCGST